MLRVDQSSWHYRYIDYWGTSVRVFEAHAPHRELVVEVTSLVEVDRTRRAVAADPVGWDELRVGAGRRPFRRVPRHSRPSPRRRSNWPISPTRSPPTTTRPATAQAIAAAVHDTMTYLPGSTGVHTLAAEAWAGAQRRVPGLRAPRRRRAAARRHPGPLRVGLPAPQRRTRRRRARSTAESHAWVEWWLGEWVGNDPTNLAEVAERHVQVGTGRDYGDVPPIKGIVAGTPVTTDLDVEVSITRQA